MKSFISLAMATTTWVATPTTHSQPRVTSISMFKDVPGYGDPKDIYGFDDDVVLPPLPSGKVLQIAAGMLAVWQAFIKLSLSAR